VSLSIYNYTNVCEYLNSLYGHKKEANGQFSLRSWSKRLGYENHSFLVQCLKGQRKFNKKIINALVSDEGLDQKEANYFFTLLYKSMAHEDDFQLFDSFLSFIKEDVELT
jgi:uncharacterized protein (TIGR02147 family)